MSDTRLRILVAAPFPPRVTGMHGGSRAIATLLTELASDHDIALLCLRGRNEPEIDAEVRQACDYTCEIPRPWSYENSRMRKGVRIAAGLADRIPMWVRRTGAPEFRRRLVETVTTWRPDVVQFEFHVMGQYADDASLSGVSRVLVQHESGSAAAAERQHPPRGTAPLMAWADLRAWREYERHTASLVNQVVTFTERDAAALLRLHPHAPVTTIPLGIRIPPAPLRATGTEWLSVLFIGSFVHYPNEDAALRLATRILPLVRRRLPLATLTIVGSEPPASVSALAGAHVRVHGSVADVAPYLDRAALVAAPMRLGSGMRVKVLEALAAGKPVVCSPLAVDGLAVHDRSEVRLAETDEQFAAAIVDLLESPAEREVMAGRARRWAETHASVRHSAAAFHRLYETLLHERQPAAVGDRSGITVPVPGAADLMSSPGHIVNTPGA